MRIYKLGLKRDSDGFFRNADCRTSVEMTEIFFLFKLKLKKLLQNINAFAIMPL